MGSLSEIADSLRSLGNLDKLHQAVISGAQTRTKFKNDNILYKSGILSEDAFDLWHTHYQAFGEETMVRRIKRARVVFEHLLSRGFGNNGVRLLDHGVCAGLLMLLSHTHFYRIFYGLGETEPSDTHKRALWKHFRVDIISKVAPVDAYWWWSGLVWATAACAIHNIQQMDPNDLPAELRETTDEGLLSLDEDPLAYLGILVDCVQEWDRYTVSHQSVFAGRLPLQGSNVTLESKDDVIILGMEKRFAEDAEKNLDRSLKDWKKHLRITNL
jgi:hypothetical protein